MQHMMVLSCFELLNMFSLADVSTYDRTTANKQFELTPDYLSSKCTSMEHSVASRTPSISASS